MKKPSKIISLILAAVMIFSASSVSVLAAIPTAAQGSVETLIQNKNLAELTGWFITSLNSAKTNVTGTALRLLYEFAGDSIGGKGRDTFSMSDEQLAKTLLDWLDANLPDWTKDITQQSWWSTVNNITKLLGITLDLKSVDGILQTVYSVCNKAGNDAIVGGLVGDLKNLNGSALKGVKRSGGDIKVLFAVLQWFNDNQSLIKQFVVGGISDSGIKLSSTMTNLIGDNLNDINNNIKNIPDCIKGWLYLLVDKYTEKPDINKNPKGGWGNSPYASYTADELIASALINTLNGNAKQSADDALAVVARSDAKAALNLSVYGLLAKYGKAIFNRFAVPVLNGELKGLIAQMKGNKAAKEFFNFDYLFTESTFDAAFKDAGTTGVLGQLNNILYACMKTMLTPEAFKAVAPVKGGNENLNENLAKLCRYVLPVLADSSSELGIDFSKFTADTVAYMDLPEMATALLKVFFPTWFRDAYAVNPNLLKQANTPAQLCAVAVKYAANTPDIMNAFTNGFDAREFTSDAVAELTDRECVELLTGFTAKLAAYLLDENSARTHFALDKAASADWTWKDYLDEIVDWAINFVKGIPAVTVRHITAERDVYDGYGPFYKANVILNELVDFSFLNNVGDETFRLDTETLLFDAILNNLFNGDFEAIVNVFTKNTNENNLFNTSIIKGLTGAADRILTALFSHTCGASAGFEKELSCTEALSGSYDTRNGHYIGTPTAAVIDSHNFAEAPEKNAAPTCTEEGYICYECAKCGEIRQEAVPPTGEHDWQETERQMQNDGSVVVIKTCSVCGNEIKEIEERLKGDVDSDGEVTAADARLALRASVGLESFEAGSAAFLGADCTGDGVIKPADARLILRRYVRLVSDSFEESADLPKPSSPSVSFSVDNYDAEKGASTVTARLVNCVGLTSGSLSFSYPDGTITKITKENGTDMKNIGDIDNAFISEFNSGVNPAEYGFYFKNYLWDSATWAADPDADPDMVVNGENFEFAQFTITANTSAYFIVTGELCFGDTVVPVNQTIGNPPAKPGDVDNDGEITTSDARLALRASVELESFHPSTSAFRSADFDDDGTITSADARKILRASVMLSTDDSELTNVPTPSSPSVSFSVGEYADGRATVSASFADCVGLTSGWLSFSYPDGTVTKIIKKNGTDAKNIGDVDNAFYSEFNSGSNPAKFGFYFKNYLWDSAAWAMDADADPEMKVNGENFEFAQYTFTAERGTAVSVTGELRFGTTTVAVNDRFLIGWPDVSVVFDVGEYDAAAGNVTVSASFVNCVGLKNSKLYLSYPDGTVTKVTKKNGVDVKNIGDVDNAFSSEFNASTNPMQFLGYFKDTLWDSAAWAAADGADAPVNGENFEFASFTFTAAPGTVITVTGELRFGDVTVPVSTSFVLGSSVTEPTTQIPKPTEPTTEPKTTERPVPETTTHPSYRPLNENGPVAFTLTRYDGSEAIISASLIDCVGVASGWLTFSYPSGNEFSYYIPGTDAEKIAGSSNWLTSDVNTTQPNRVSYGFYFKEILWDNDIWAKTDGVTGSFDARRFEFASFRFLLAPGTVITVTGTLQDINGIEKTVNESFQIGEAPSNPEIPVQATEDLYDCYGNKILGYDKNGMAIIGFKFGQFIYSSDPNAHRIHAHNMINTVIKPATCTEPGEGAWMCTICGMVSSTYTIEPKGHNPDNGRVTKPATCKEEGEMTYTCYNCGEILRTEVIPKPKDHQWDLGKVTKAATATAGGEMLYTCKLCGDTRTEKTEKLAIAETGSCGENVTYTLWNSGLLEISGTGAMNDYSYGEVPWFRNSTVREVKIGKGVTTIPEGAFSQCHMLQSVSIADGVTDIVYATFSLCTGLETVELPQSVKSIGSNAFYGCGTLKKVELPKNVTTIGRSAFCNCDELTEVVLPKKLETVGEYAFAYSEKLAKLTPPAGVTDVDNYAFTETAWYAAQPEGIVYFGKVLYKYKGTPQPVPANSGKKPTGYYETNVMPEGTELTVKAGTVRIADYAFQNCYGLVGLTLPEGLLSIGRSALSSCRNLAKVNFPDSLIELGSGALPYYYDWAWFQSQPDGVVYVGKIAYRYKGEAKPFAALTLKDGTTQIYSEAFYEQANLKKITIPESVAAIGYYAFTDCRSLESVRIPKAVTAIESNTFSGCASLTEAVLQEGLEVIDYYAFQGCEKLAQITLPESLTTIEYGAFQNCSSLKEITIPKNVTTFSESAFADCALLERGAVHADNPVYYSAGDCIIEKETKAVLLGGSASVLPDDVTAIVYNAFAGRTELKEITIPASVKTLGGFSRCTGLTEIEIPDGVTEISRYAFSGCTGLTGELVIPNSVTSMGYQAFYRCTGLTSVRLSDNLTVIEESAFSRCTGLTDIVIPGKVERIGYGAFSNCTGLTNITIPQNVKTIDWEAFENCGKLTGVTIEDGVKTIGGYAFYGCDSLAGISIPTSVTYIGNDAIPVHTVIYGKPGSYAQTWAQENGRAFVVLDEAYLTMYAAPVVNVPTAEVYGYATPGAQVKLTLNGKKAATVTAAGSGYWSTSIPLKGAKEGGSFTLKASVTWNKKTVTAEETVVYRPNAVLFREFEMRHSYYSATVTETTLSTVPNFTIVPGYPFSFRVAVTNNDRIGKLWVVSTENGVSKKMALTYNEVTGEWFSGEGFFEDTDRSYVPGVFTVEGVDKDGKAFDCGVTIRFRFLIDPSGYVYEAVQSNLIEGAQVSVFYQDETGRELLWNAAEAGQTNPVTTLADGAFSWDVPKGRWQVQVSKSGYETAKSDWMDVPPEWKNVFISLVSSESPTVKALNVYADHADILFSTYMAIDSVNTDTVMFEGYTGKIVPVDKTETAKKSGVFYATTFRFTPEKPFAGEVKVQLKAASVKEEEGKAPAIPAPVKTDGGKNTDGGDANPWTETGGFSGIQNYAGKALRACEATFKVTAAPKNLSVEKTLSVVYGEKAELIVSAENAAGMTVTVACDNADVSLSEKTLTLDENGKATLTVTGEMPGMAKLTFALEGTALTAGTEVTVTLPEPETPDVMIGDVDGDGELSSGDARLALRASVKLESYEEGSAAYIAADVDRNGVIESSDARMILRASVKLEDPTKW